MWLVVGLGNPGDDYANTRHNIGFIVIDTLAARLSIPIRQRTTDFLYGRGLIEEQKAILIKPRTFMNRSGLAIRTALRKYEGINNILVVHDDLDLDTGIIRIRKTGSSGGHNGIESIIESLGTKDFIRLKIGIGRSDRISPEKYVLRSFNKQERPIMEEAVEKAADAIPIILNRGVSLAQNMFHKT
jgi:PTH1 family peptidyl-tRNA hydrolase